ncbi:MAG: hypothetical protein IPI91_19885 [Flavobacteriales bacterium]|nr:hypothetical protein [Flavobacteriales bacterium]
MVLPAVNALPIKTIANATTDKKAEIGQLIVAYALNDSVGIADMALAETNARAMAIALNKDNVQKRIVSTLRPWTKLKGGWKAHRRTFAKNDKALEKAKKRVRKRKKPFYPERRYQQVKSEVTGLENKFGITKDPKDPKRLTKARGKLSKKKVNLPKQ